MVTLREALYSEVEHCIEDEYMYLNTLTHRVSQRIPSTHSPCRLRSRPHLPTFGTIFQIGVEDYLEGLRLQPAGSSQDVSTYMCPSYCGHQGLNLSIGVSRLAEQLAQMSREWLADIGTAKIDKLSILGYV